MDETPLAGLAGSFGLLDGLALVHVYDRAVDAFDGLKVSFKSLRSTELSVM